MRTPTVCGLCSIIPNCSNCEWDYDIEKLVCLKCESRYAYYKSKNLCVFCGSYCQSCSVYEEGEIYGEDGELHTIPEEARNDDNELVVNYGQIICN